MTEERIPPIIGDRFYIPWRDNEAIVVGLPFGGNVIDIQYVESWEQSAISLGDWMNWIGDRNNRLKEPGPSVGEVKE